MLPEGKKDFYEVMTSTKPPDIKILPVAFDYTSLYPQQSYYRIHRSEVRLKKIKKILDGINAQRGTGSN